MLESFKPGQTIKCTIVRQPHAEDDVQTVARLMRFNPDFKRRLKNGQIDRMRNLYVRSRGLRPWEVRREAPKIVVPTKGMSWTMPYFANIAPDFRSVERFLKVEKA